MKRLLCLVLTLIMVFALSASAWAEVEIVEVEEEAAGLEAGLESTLSDVTLAVKNTLGISDDYTDFYSSYSDDILPQWYLTWSSDTEQISITASTEGLVLDVYRWNTSDSYDSFYGFDAAFPAIGQEEAHAQAEDWLARLLDEDETARIDSVRTSLGTDGYYRFSGTILINGLESPVTFSLSIDGDGLYSYYRSDEYDPYVGETPEAQADITQAQAAAELADAVALELYYVTDSDGVARLQYVPCGPDMVVDALTGEAVDMDALYASLSAVNASRSTMAYAADTVAEEETADAGGLTEVELASIANYGEAMSQEELDAALRAVETLGLADGYTLQSCSYSMDSDTGDVTASLRYTAAVTAERLFGYPLEEFEEYQSYGYSLTASKYITTNAKTGQITYVYTSYPLYEEDEDAQMDETSRQAAAEAFLADIAGEMFGESGLCTLIGYEEKSGYTYARLHDGYFYPENYLYVTVNPATGTIDRYDYVWDEETEFADSQGIVDEETATAAYVDALEVTLGYVAWPTAIEGAEDEALARWVEWGYDYVQTLRLAWYFNGVDSLDSIDALTGQPVGEDDSDEGDYTYDDLEDVAQAEMIQALAQAGIGFSGGSFHPETELTQRDALILLIQANGSTPSLTDDERLQRQAVNAGFITAGAFDPDKTVTRMEFLTMLIGASRYGDAAELTSVWASGFTDVDEADEGFAAIAKALNLIDGDTLRPDDPCTRAEAAEILYRFMSR
ncbi:MAG: S-layer homology domain-containing protein [Oscillospiraceae bacterium]|nr:S-layer homology domain-containing protein [Oscillospiraceae bacterium]